MSFNGSGTFNRIFNWVTDLGNSVLITASRMDTEMDGFATGLSTCITKDGQTTITNNIPMNVKKFTGLNNGSVRTDSIALGQVQDSTYGNLGLNGGTPNTYTASPSPAITAYTASQRFTIEINTGDSVTGAATLNINGVNADAWEKYDGAGSTTALEVDDMVAGQKYDIIRDQANTKFITLNPEKPFFDGINLGSSGTLVLISSVTASSSSEITFTDLNSTFIKYVLELSNIRPSTNSAILSIRTSTNNGSSYDSGASDYQWLFSILREDGLGSTELIGSGDESAGVILLTTDQTDTRSINGTLEIKNPSANDFTTMTSSMAGADAGVDFYLTTGTGTRLTSQVVDAVRIFFSAGNIASGTIKLYGVIA